MNASTAAIWKMKMMRNGETGEVMILNLTPGVNGMLTANKRSPSRTFVSEWDFGLEVTIYLNIGCEEKEKDDSSEEENVEEIIVVFKRLTMDKKNGSLKIGMSMVTTRALGK